MKSFRNFIKEEVLPTVQVADGGLDISKPAVRAAINAAIAGVVSQPAVTPYVVFNRLSKLLAQYHIVLPKRFLEGDKGVEVFEVKQFGHKMGMTDSGEFVNEVPSTHYLFLQYGILSPFGITYAKPVVGGMFKVMARLVDKEELDKLMDMAEITMAEEAEQMQAIAKANAPRDEMHDITSDEKKKGNKAAVADSEKGLHEAMTRKQKDMAVRRFMSHDPEAGERILATGKKERAEKKSFASARSEINRKKTKATFPNVKHTTASGHPDWEKHGIKDIPTVKEEENDLKDSCWKGYTAKGLKKKGNRMVPNCVPVSEGALDGPSPDQLKKEREGHPNVYHSDVSYASSAERMKSGRPFVDPHRTEINKDIQEARIDERYHVVTSKYSLEPGKIGQRTSEDEIHSKHKSLKAAAKKLTTVIRTKKDANRYEIHDTETGKRMSRNQARELGESSKEMKRNFLNSVAKVEKQSQKAGDFYWNSHHHPKEVGKAKEDHERRVGLAKKVFKRYQSQVDEQQIDELKKSTLASYIKKAHVSGLAAADDAANAYHRKDYKELHKQNRTGEKRESGVNLAADKLSGRARVSANEETQISEKLTKKTSIGKTISDFVHSDDPKFAGKSTKERQKMALGAYYGMHPEKSKKKVDEQSLEELNREQGSMINRYIGATRHDYSKKREAGRRLALQKKWGDKQFGLPEPKVKAVDRSVKEDTLDETSEKLRLAYTNKAMQQTRQKETKPGEHYKREVGIHRAARLMLRDKKKEQINELHGKGKLGDINKANYKKMQSHHLGHGHSENPHTHDVHRGNELARMKKDDEWHKKHGGRGFKRGIKGFAQSQLHRSAKKEFTAKHGTNEELKFDPSTETQKNT